MPKAKSTNKKEVVKVVIMIALVVGVVVGVNLGLRVALGTSTPVVVVTSPSMVPTLNIGDVCMIQSVSAEQYVVGDHFSRTGDIIVFDAPGESDPIIHRIVNRTFASGHYFFVTQGDNNAVTDEPRWGWIEDTNVHGKVVFTIPWIGNIFLALRAGGIWLVVLALAVIIILIFYKETHQMEEKVKEKVESQQGVTISVSKLVY